MAPYSLRDDDDDDDEDDDDEIIIVIIIIIIIIIISIPWACGLRRELVLRLWR